MSAPAASFDASSAPPGNQGLFYFTSEPWYPSLTAEEKKILHDFASGGAGAPDAARKLLERRREDKMRAAEQGLCRYEALLQIAPFERHVSAFLLNSMIDIPLIDERAEQVIFLGVINFLCDQHEKGIANFVKENDLREMYALQGEDREKWKRNKAETIAKGLLPIPGVSVEMKAGVVLNFLNYFLG